MNKYFITILGILCRLTLYSQYDVITYEKQQLNIESIPTVSGGEAHIMPITIHSQNLNSRIDYKSFIEKDDSVFYFFNRTLYNLSSFDPNNSKISSFPIKGEESWYLIDTVPHFLKKHEVLSEIKDPSFLIDKKNRFWVYPKRRGVFLFENNKWTDYSKKTGLPSNQINHIIEDSRGNIWLATKKGLCKYDNNRWIKFGSEGSNLTIPNITMLATALDGGVWFTTDDNKLGQCNDAGIRFIPFPFDRILSIISDDYNNLWINVSNKFGNDTLTARVFTDNKVKIYDKSEGFNNELVLKTHVDSRNNLWIVTSESIGLLSYNQKEILMFPAAVWDIQSLYEDDDNRIWFIGKGGTAYYDYLRKRLVSLNELFNIITGSSSRDSFLSQKVTGFGHPHGTIFCNSDLLKDSQGNLLYSQYSIVKEISSAMIVDILKVKQFAVLLLFIGDDMINLLDKLNGKDNRPLSTFMDSDGNVWVDTPMQIHKFYLKN